MIPGFMGNMFVAGEPLRELVLIDRTTGTNIGDMTGSGGLAASFDGITNQTSAACSTKSATTAGFVGKSLVAPRRIGRAVAYGSNNSGYRTGTSNVTLNLYAKVGTAPTSPTNGTLIGSTGSFANVLGTNSKTIDSTDLSTIWDHVWLAIATTSGSLLLAELELYAWE